MDVLGAAVASVVTCVCSCMSASVSERCQHLENPTKALEVLRSKKEELVDRLEDVLERLQKAEKQGQTRTREVQNWLDKVKTFITAVEVLEKKVRETKGCLNGVLPHCSLRLNLGREVSKLVVDVTYLLEKADQLSDERLSFLLSEVGMEMATARLFGKETAEKNLEKVWEFLLSDEIKIIGVYGMGGIGKTTMVKNIHNRLLKQRNCFDKILWITVSRDANAYKLQNDIAREIKIDLSNEQDETRRSSLLLKELRRNGKFLLILDDMWEEFPLYEIGIPIDLNEDNGSKLVLTTRSLDVCQKMECQKKVQVELLSENGSWELFTKTVGVKLAPKVEKIAKKLAKECSCLPLAIVTVGGAMKGNDDVHDWRNALDDLRESTNCVIKMEEKVIQHLKFSYNRLEDDIVKNCFLYCAWFPEDFKLNSEELIDHWVMEGLINSKRIQNGVDRGHGILNRLKCCCLLEVVTNDLSSKSVEVWVKMHDLIRDMALSIVNMNPRIMIKAGVKMEDFPDESGWIEDLEKVSLVGSRINAVLISPRVSRLTTLLLNYCHSLTHIAYGFFVHMECLQVLNLCHNYELQFLPESVSDLVHLLVLDASSCHKLQRIPSVEKLLLLKVLRLSHTAIEELPHGMEALVNLKRLDIMGTNIDEVTCSLISKLSLLQELLLWPLPISSDRLPLSFAFLENVWICFKNLSDFSHHVRVDNFGRLNDFDFRVGGPYIGSTENRTSRSVSIAYDPHETSKISFNLPQNTEELFICTANEVLRSTELFCLKDAKELRKCTFAAFSKLEYVMSEDESHILQKLEKLTIYKCIKLIGLYKGVPSHGIFPCLKKLKLEHCHSIRYLLSFTLLKYLHNLMELNIYTCNNLEEIIRESEEEKAVIRKDEGTCSYSTVTKTAGLKKLELRNLPKLKMLFQNGMSHFFQNLEEVEIKDCQGMEELISEEDGVRNNEVRDGQSNNNNSSIVLPRLKTLTLYNLPKLRKIWRGEMVCNSLQSVQVSRCVKLQSIPQFGGKDQSPPPSMKQITGSIRWWDSLQWDGTSFSKNLLQPFFRQDHNAQEAEELDREVERIDVEADEEINEALRCGFCSKLLYMPVVVACGHIFCSHCLVKAMGGRFMSAESKCQTCRYPITHMTSLCQILHFLVMEKYPLAYKRRQIHTLEEVNTRGYTYLYKHYVKVAPTLTIEENTARDGSCELISLDDVLCVICKNMLIQPVVLNCGHVFCQSCISDTTDEPIRCKLCQRRHPQGILKVCIELEHLLENRFCEEYALRRQAVGFRPIQGGEEQDPKQCSHSTFLLGDRSVHVHSVICDDCQMWPIVGERYKCRNCKGFNLCGHCYHSQPNMPVHYDQNHKSEHTFELIEIIVLEPRNYSGSEWSPLTEPL